VLEPRLRVCVIHVDLTLLQIHRRSILSITKELSLVIYFSLESTSAKFPNFIHFCLSHISGRTWKHLRDCQHSKTTLCREWTAVRPALTKRLSLETSILDSLVRTKNDSRNKSQASPHMWCFLSGKSKLKGLQKEGNWLFWPQKTV
jgi:hypothetical protein